MSRQRGVGLTELMISLCLSTLLMMALIQTYLNSKRHYNQLQASLEQGLELQLVSELIRDSVRSAGFAPCIGMNHVISKDRRGKFAAGLLAMEVGPGKSQSLTLSHMSEDFVTVLKQLSPTRLLLDGWRDVDKKRALVVADCFHAEVHLIADRQKTPEGWVVTLKKSLDFQYSSPFYLGEWLEERFYIEKNSQGKLALFYDASHPEELTDLINGLSSQLVSQKGSTLLRVTLRLAKGGEIVLDTQVRTP